MESMSESMAPVEEASADVPLPAWQTWIAAISAWLMAALFIVAGVWKLTDPLAAAIRMTQALVPQALSLPAALGFGISETLAGILLLVPRFRRWGALLTVLLLVAFIIYIGMFYSRLNGEECNCFPWVERAVGPAFFIGDAIMIVFATAAGWWARPSRGIRSAAIVLGAVCVFAALNLGVALTRTTAVTAPETIAVDGKPFPLREGRVFLYFFNPECLHCAAGARELAGLQWGETKVIAVATQLPEFGQDFLDTTGLKAALTADAEALRSAFSFVDVPYGVALEQGTQRAAFTHFDDGSALAQIRKLGFAH